MTINVLEDTQRNCNFNSYFELVDRYVCKLTASKNGIYLYLKLQKSPLLNKRNNMAISDFWMMSRVFWMHFFRLKKSFTELWEVNSFPCRFAIHPSTTCEEERVICRGGGPKPQAAWSGCASCQVLLHSGDNACLFPFHKPSVDLFSVSCGAFWLL